MDEDINEEEDVPLPPLKTMLTTEANRLRLVDLFNKWDADQDGWVSRREFRQAVRALGNYDLDDINNVFKHSFLYTS